MLLNNPAGKTVAKCQMITIQFNVHNVSAYLMSLKTVRVETLRCTINFSAIDIEDGNRSFCITFKMRTTTNKVHIISQILHSTWFSTNTTHFDLRPFHKTVPKDYPIVKTIP